VVGEILIRVWKRIEVTKESPGIDEMTMDDLTGSLKQNRPLVREGSMTEEFCRQPVKKVLVPRPDGNDRYFEIPTAMDMDIERFFDRANIPFLWDGWAER
jgi:RNA-directed DNA polymerase